MALSGTGGVNSVNGMTPGSSLRDFDTVSINGPVVQNRQSPTSGVVAPVPTPTDVSAFEKSQSNNPLQVSADYKRNMAMASGVKFMVDVMNANNAYRNIEGTAQMNIIQARNQAADSLYRGRQAAFNSRSEGYQLGERSGLNAAAQGQDLSGAGAEKVRASYEAMGIMNGMQEEANSISEALGFELEEINYDYQVESAGIQRDQAIIGAAINGGISAYQYGAM